MSGAGEALQRGGAEGGGEGEGVPPVGVCARCRVPMATGSLVQRFEASYERMAWRSDDGTLMQRLFHMNRLDIVALRCPKCARVELYAPEGG